MTDHPDEPPTQPAGEEPSAAPDRVEPVESTTVRRRSPLVRALRTVLAIVTAIVAAGFVTLFTIDLGPELRGRAEREGSKFIERPMHIGRLSAKLRPGVFVVEDLVIEGLTPQDRPFLTAKKITVEVPWWTVFSRKLIIESVAMTDWNMVIETFPNGRHNFPKFTRKTPSKGPSRFTTTLRSVAALRGSFTYEDHGTPWSTSARDLNVLIFRPPVATNYLGRASFSDGTVKIQSYESFRTNMQSRFTIDGPHRALRPHGFDRRRIPVGRHRRRRFGALAGADLSGALENRLSHAERASSFTARSSRPPARAISPARFISSRAAAS